MVALVAVGVLGSGSFAPGEAVAGVGAGSGSVAPDMPCGAGSAMSRLSRQTMHWSAMLNGGLIVEFV